MDAARATTASANYVSVWSVNKAGVDSNGIPTPGITGPATVTVDPYALPANARRKRSPGRSVIHLDSSGFNVFFGSFE